MPTTTRIRRGAPGLRGLLVFLAATVGAPAAGATGAPREDGKSVASRYLDPSDGWFDVSGFLDTAYGFVPVASPITEPAVGYGLAGALVFVDRPDPEHARRNARPDLAVAGALATRNGTQGLFAAHLGTWLDGRLRTLAGFADADVNLEFFGLGRDRGPADAGIGYGIRARGGAVGASYQVGETPLWIGLQYGAASTNVSLDRPNAGLPILPLIDFDLELAALTPSLTLDTRDNFFTPTRGWYVDLSLSLFREVLGSDREFEKAGITAIHYRPLSTSAFLGVRAAANASSGGTPYFLRPFVSLRGVEAMRYQGEEAGEIEAELRWQMHPRFSVVGFAGAGLARSDSRLRGGERTVSAAGAGFRYLLARTYGLHMGIDVAVGPDQPVLYVVFGSAWMRP